jgi:hypothetical protein
LVPEASKAKRKVMSTVAYAWLVIATAFFAANLPFLSHRVFGLFKYRADAKPLWLHLMELLVLYLAVGALALVIEHQQGQRYPQRWEFYAVTATLFLTFAFPGFVYRYLRKS